MNIDRTSSILVTAAYTDIKVIMVHATLKYNTFWSLSWLNSQIDRGLWISINLQLLTSHDICETAAVNSQCDGESIFHLLHDVFFLSSTKELKSPSVIFFSSNNDYNVELNVRLVSGLSRGSCGYLELNKPYNWV